MARQPLSPAQQVRTCLLLDGLKTLRVRAELELQWPTGVWDNLFFPSWAFALPITPLRLCYSFVKSFIFSGIVYNVTGLDSNPGRLVGMLQGPAW
ncbi:hypothetical protein WJX84_007257 [Apatococcus fuscideae]|uniref:Uncharacterized protein n=1 Tax=Apatococcus fuscideae TaxID=2026836 RepID=A0AAW1SXR9_9CHLO